MSGYIYITGAGADPGAGRVLTDPIFRPVATLGACMPNIRRVIGVGQWVFIVSGRLQSVPQYLVGGIRVAEKIDAIEAHARFPDYRLVETEQGIILGNVPVNTDGSKHPLDKHSKAGFERRARNYIIGDQSVTFDGDGEVEVARRETLEVLGNVMNKKGNRVIDIIGRSSKLEDEQVEKILKWMRQIKSAAQ